MRLDQGLAIGSRGGHGPIKYVVCQYQEGRSVRFQFLRPLGFDGWHQLEVQELSTGSCEVLHEISLRISGWNLLYWWMVIEPLHDALIEDAFDLLELQTNPGFSKSTKWTIWVKSLRFVFKQLHRSGKKT